MTALPPHEEFDLLYIRWSRLRDLLSSGAVSADLGANLGLTVAELERRMLMVNPAWRAVPFPSQPLFRNAA
jgi:hypothetical protein